MTQRTMSIGGATFDLFITLERTKEMEEDATHLCMRLGEKLKVENVAGFCGGGACNTAVGLKRLGCGAGFCGVIADDEWGNRMLRSLRKEGVDTSAATIVECETSSFSLILLPKGGERVILYTPGTNVHLHDVTFDRDKIAQQDWVYLNHLQPGSCVIEDDVRAVLAGKPKPRLTWNPGGCQIDAGLREKENAKLLTQTDLFLLNTGEALRFTGQRSIDAALNALISAGAGIACITQGPDGATATDGKQTFHCPILPAPIRDTTGAGDSFGVGMTWALLQGFDLPAALKAGTINAASVVGVIGAQPGLLAEAEMKDRLQKIHLNVDELGSMN